MEEAMLKKTELKLCFKWSNPPRDCKRGMRINQICSEREMKGWDDIIVGSGKGIDDR
jgi:hypothetical protein